MNHRGKVSRSMQARDSGLSAGLAATCRVADSRILRIPVLIAAFVGMCVAVRPATIAWGQSIEESDERREYNIKLAYLCTFARYITSPDDTAGKKRNDAWIIGVLGKDPFRGALDKIVAKKRQINGRTIVARHFALLDDYRRCDVLFIPKTVPRKRQEAALRALRGKPVLVVGEIEGFAAIGGCIGFYRDEDSVRLEINPDALRDHRLTVSSKLLSLAKIVPTKRGGGEARKSE
jgi:hypothetical protein